MARRWVLSLLMIIGILGYFTIPTVAGWIIQAGGMGSAARPINQIAGRAGAMTGAAAGAVAGNLAGRAGHAAGNAAGSMGRGAVNGAKKVAGAAGRLFRRK